MAPAAISPMAVQELRDPGQVRPIRARWVITGEAFLVSAAHLGGHGNEATDMPVLRDARKGLPLLPGTTLAGALRGHLADVLGGYRSIEDPRVVSLFGGRRGEESGSQSPMIVFDAFGRVPGTGATEIRDGVSIDPASGTAEEHKKFDLETLPPGTTFNVRLELIVEDVAREPELLTLLEASLGALTQSEMSLGARRSRGLGRLSARAWRAVRYDFSSAAGCLTWLLSDPLSPIRDDVAEETDPGAALRSAWPRFSSAAIVDRRNRVCVDASLTFAGGLLVRSPGTAPDSPDVVHLHSGGRPVLPGTSLAGVLRSRALRIARLVRARHGDADLWVTALFGPRFEGTSATVGFDPQGSRLRVSEGTLDGTPMRPSRIRIDRFTQGVAPSALFEEEPQYAGHVPAHLELRNPCPGETGLLLLLLKDLLTGDLALGGTASVGRGIAKGAATVRLEDGLEFRIQPDRPLDDSARERVNELIRAFHDEARPSRTDTGAGS